MRMHAFMTAREIVQGIRSGSLNRLEVTAYFHDRSIKWGQKLGALLEVFDKDSLAQDPVVSHGIMDGVPGFIKDNICQEGRITSCASNILKNYRAVYDATVVSRLKQQGAVLLGRANMDEFAMGSSTETSAYGPAYNPWDITRVPGGSSGGSAAAVAAGLAPWALGSETGGSVRQPAGFCNLVGLKPTYGLLSRYGLIAYASSLDQVGIFARTAYDTALVLSAMAGIDERDATTRAVSAQDYTRSCGPESSLHGLRIGVVRSAVYADGIHQDVHRVLADALRKLESLGCVLVDVDIPLMQHSAAVYFMVSRAEAASNLARFDGVRYGMRHEISHDLQELYQMTRHEGFGSQVIRRILIGNYALSAGHADAYYERAKRIQSALQVSTQDLLKSVDLLFMPTSPAGAFALGAFADDPLAMDLQDYFTALANLVGMPALQIPGGFTSNGLPVGFQLMGPALSEPLLLAAAHVYQQHTDWHQRVPTGYQD
jgi:aspartyl-tRNA(Asn)/glutamyl-tRNA(Gln) amidotransferase subunit A